MMLQQGQWLKKLACLWIGYLLLATCALAQTALPESVKAALKKASIDEKDVSIVVADANPKGKTWLLFNEKTVMHPASVIKLVTTFAALDILGPDYVWKTAVFADGQLDSNGVLNGSLYIRGSGDPSMTSERLRDLLLQVRASGIQHIKGNLVLDGSVYNIPEVDPGAFDGEPLRVYNVAPDALLMNYKTVALIFNPALTKSGEQMPVLSDPLLSGVKLDAKVSAGAQKKCGDWKAALQADFSDPLNFHFNGSFPVVCGPKRWYIAYPEPRSYALRAVSNLWQQLGGTIGGPVKVGRVASSARLIAEGDSKSMAEIVRDINKYSNNVMAQSVFLALSLPDQKTILNPQPLASAATWGGSRSVLQGWWQQRMGRQQMPVMDNGSGLSRKESITALSLAVMMQYAWQSPVMPEFIASMPIAGVDGTMRRSKAQASAHIKTGSINGVVARAGYVLAHDGSRRVLVFFVNSPNAAGAREAIDALIDWSAAL